MPEKKQDIEELHSSFFHIKIKIEYNLLVNYMENSLIYFYNINISEIKKIKNKYYFSHNNNNYVIEKYNRNINEALSIYKLNQEMIEFGYPTFQIIPTKFNTILFENNQDNYVLMIMPKINNRIISFNDIKQFNYIPKEESITVELNKPNWPKLWEEKIDYYEYEFKEIKNKYPLINESMPYYIGLSENAISYFNDNLEDDKLPKVVSHLRLNVNTDLYEFYNPLNLVIDFKERDIGEYLKDYVMNKNYTEDKLNEYITINNNSKETIIALICRILFASYYFDIYEQIIKKEIKEENIKDIIDKRKNISFLLKLIFSKYKHLNIPIINWIVNYS